MFDVGANTISCIWPPYGLMSLQSEGEKFVRNLRISARCLYSTKTGNKCGQIKRQTQTVNKSELGHIYFYTIFVCPFFLSFFNFYRCWFCIRLHYVGSIGPSASVSTLTSGLDKSVFLVCHHPEDEDCYHKNYFM